jgi:hypothetical protein
MHGTGILGHLQAVHCIVKASSISGCPSQAAKGPIFGSEMSHNTLISISYRDRYMVLTMRHGHLQSREFDKPEGWVYKGLCSLKIN